MFFDKIQAAPADPILGLGEAFKAETRAEKVNLGIGVYKDAQGQTPILKSVKEAETRLLAQENTKNYLTIDGVAAYNAATQELLFGAEHRAKFGWHRRIACGSRIHQTPNQRAKRVDFCPNLAKSQRHFQRSGHQYSRLSLLQQTSARLGLGRLN